MVSLRWWSSRLVQFDGKMLLGSKSEPTNIWAKCNKLLEPRADLFGHGGIPLLNPHVGVEFPTGRFAVERSSWSCPAICWAELPPNSFGTQYSEMLPMAAMVGWHTKIVREAALFRVWGRENLEENHREPKRQELFRFFFFLGFQPCPP